jgi:hypothetical protein
LSFFNIEEEQEKKIERNFLQFLIDHIISAVFVLFCFICIKTTYTQTKGRNILIRVFNQINYTDKKKDYEAAADDGGEGVLSFVSFDGK